MALTKIDRRLRIKRRIRSKISGCNERPRMSVFRSNKQIFVQLVNDEDGTTLTAASSLIKEIAAQSGTKTEKAAMVGKLIAEKALAKGIEKVVFDRNGYLYHGRVKKLAEAAREAGLKF
ncbi:MAG: 50S ribosomal protein L18 [Marinilabiliaceae bacterium]|nr:50S ribosomal protein L18 [Marinilabiliaceae bacterium]